jgi:hypothetical protein
MSLEQNRVNEYSDILSKSYKDVEARYSLTDEQNAEARLSARLSSIINTHSDLKELSEKSGVDIKELESLGGGANLLWPDKINRIQSEEEAIEKLTRYLGITSEQLKA